MQDVSGKGGGQEDIIMSYKITKSGKYIPDETEEQKAVFKWAALQRGKYPQLRKMYHIPNEGKRSKLNGANLKAMGLTPGASDICLPVPRGKYHGLYIELKAMDGVPSSAQLDFLSDMQAEGYCAAVCYGAHQAIDLIREYMELGKFRQEAQP